MTNEEAIDHPESLREDRLSFITDEEYHAIIPCSDCLRFRSFGNGYGECLKQRKTLTVKENDYCSQAIRTDRLPDEHKYSGLTDE